MAKIGKNDRIGSGDLPSIDGYGGGKDDFYVQRQSVILDGEMSQENTQKLHATPGDMEDVN
jgi:hypothetical protein